MKWPIPLLAAAATLAACGDSTGNSAGGSSRFTRIVTSDDGLFRWAMGRHPDPFRAPPVMRVG